MSKQILQVSNSINAESTSSHVLGLYFQTPIIETSGAQCTFDGPLNIAQSNARRIRVNDIAKVEYKDSYSSVYILIDVNVFDIVNYKSENHLKQKISFTKPTINLDVTMCNAHGQVYTSGSWAFVIQQCECL